MLPCGDDPSPGIYLQRCLLWRAAKKAAKQTGKHRFVPLSIEHHVAQSNDMALAVRSPFLGACLFGYAHLLGVARRFRWGGGASDIGLVGVDGTCSICV
jgi:hypothetical protein